MTEDQHKLDLSRRTVLAGLGTIGVASAGAGLGTSAYLNDTETFSDNVLTAGTLDLKVDWEEHYYDGSAGSSYVNFSDPGDAVVGFPDPDNPHVWIDAEGVDEFMDSTAIEAFPDPDNDGAQEFTHVETEFEYEPCADGADLDTDLDPTGLRTDNDDTEGGAPLINLQDVKPGDFGEFTFSLHLCDNPGYIWLQASNVSEAENGQTEPEATVDDDSSPDLAEHIETVWWYDARGDNVLQTNCEEQLYLIDSVSGTDTPSKLFDVDLSGSTADLTLLHEATANGNFDQTDAIAATPNGDAVIFYDKESGHLGRYTIDTDSFTDEGQISGDPGGVVLAGYSPTGTLWAASQNTDRLYTVDLNSPSVTDQGDTGIDLMGADLVFSSDGTMYIWTADGSQQGLYKVDDPSSDPTAVPVDTSNIGNQDATITGLAIRDAGTGNLVASDRDNDDIVVIDRTDGSITDRYNMELNGAEYPYDFGDMTAGAYCGEVFHRGTLKTDLDVLSSGVGIPLDGNRATPFDELGGISASGARECFVPGVNHYIGFAWWVPTEVGNEIQGDSVTFDLGFYTEQCRHNDGEGPTNAGT